MPLHQLLRAPMAVLARVISTTRVETRGAYSVQNLTAFKEYHRTTSWYQALAVCLLTPVPCLLATYMLDLIPLEPITAGAGKSHMVWLRLFLVCFTLTVCLSNQYRLHIPLLQLTRKTVFILGVSVSGICTYTSYQASLKLGYPLPFTVFALEIPWFPTFWLLIFVFQHRQLCGDRLALHSFVQYHLVQFTQACMSGVYPIYNYVFGSLSPNEQVGFLLVLPMLKVVFRNMMHHSIHDSDDVKPEVIVFNVELYHALFVSFCMQQSSSWQAVLFVLAIDLVQAFSTINEINRLDFVRKTLMDSVGKRSDPNALGQRAQIHRSTPTQTDQFAPRCAGQHRVAPYGPIKMDMEPDLTIRPVLVKALISVWVKIRTNWSLKRANRVNIACSDAPRHYGPRVCSEIRPPVLAQAAIQHLPSRPRGVQPAIQLPGNKGEAVTAIECQLHYVTEFAVLVEYMEVVMPFVYSISVLLLLQLDNRVFYPFTRGLDDAAVRMATQKVALYASVKLIAMIIQGCILWWRVEVSALHQLAYALKKRQESIQSKLVLWVICIINIAIEQFGSDYSFQFKWLHNQTDTSK